MGSRRAREVKEMPMQGVMRAVAMVVLAFAGCAKAKPYPEEEVLRAFLGDLRARRADAAWAVLSESSKHELERRHAALMRAMGKEVGETKPAKMLFEQLGVMSLAQPESIVMTSAPGDDVRMQVSVKDGKSAEIRMVKEGGAWKVDLMGSLKPAPPLTEALKGAKPVEETDTSTSP